MEFTKLSKAALMEKCEELGIKKVKTKIDMIRAIEEASKPKTLETSIEIKNECGFEYLKTIQDNSIGLILTDPPYIISKDSGMNELYNNVKHNEENNITQVKTEEEWEEALNNQDSGDDGPMTAAGFGAAMSKLPSWKVMLATIMLASKIPVIGDKIKNTIISSVEGTMF
jgi:hypothetical protein